VKKIALDKGGKETLKSTPTRKKRTRSDELLDTLQVIQENQSKQMELITNMYGFLYNLPFLGNTQFQNCYEISQQIQEPGIQQENYQEIRNNQDIPIPESFPVDQNAPVPMQTDEFENAFQKLVDCYKKTKPIRQTY